MPAPGSQGLTLGELEPLAGALLAVLLPFVLTRVASEEPELLQPSPQFGVELHQCPGDAQPGRARLSGDAATAGENDQVELIRGFGGRHSLADRGPGAFGREVI